MHFMDKLAADAATRFKETADRVWESLGGPEASQSKTVKGAKYSAGKYAVTATMVNMMNFPDNAPLFAHVFNVTGNGPDGVQGFAASKSVTANRIARALDNTQNVAQNLALQATAAQGFADVSATSTLSDLNKILPVLTKAPTKEAKGKPKGTK